MDGQTRKTSIQTKAKPGVSLMLQLNQTIAFSLVVSIGLVSALWMYSSFRQGLSMVPVRNYRTLQDKTSILTSKLLDTLQQYQQAESVHQQVLFASLKATAEQRSRAVQSLLATAPKSVLKNGLTIGQWLNLPEEIKPLVEHTEDVTGIFHIVILDDFEGGSSKTEYAITDKDGRTFRLLFAGDIPKIQSGSKISIYGVQFESMFLVSERDGSVMMVDPPVEYAVIGEKRIATILFNFIDKPEEPYTVEHVRNVILDSETSAQQYWTEATFDQMYFNATVDVFGWYTIDSSWTSCENWLGWLAAARQAAAQDFFNPESYDYVVYASPYADCGFAGIAYLWSDFVYLNGSMNDATTLVHELGHAFGFHHASRLFCTDASGHAVPLSDNCYDFEYGDAYDVMGSSSRFNHVNAHSKSRAGWFAEGNAVEVTGEGDYTVVPIEWGGDGVKYLRIPRMIPGEDLTYLFVEFRRNWGFDSNMPDTEGVLIKISPIYDEMVQTYLLDMTPEDTGDELLKVGQRFLDPATGIGITLSNVTEDQAVVIVEFGVVGNDTIDPSLALLQPEENAHFGPNETFTIEAEASDAGFIRTIELYLGDTLIKECSPNAIFASCSVDYTLSDQQPGILVIRAKAIDQSDNESETGIDIVVEDDLAAGWPKNLEHYLHAFRPLLTADILPESGKEFVLNEESLGYIRNNLFVPMPGWPVAFPDGFPNVPASLGRKNEAVSIAFSGERELWVYAPDGQIRGSWPRQVTGNPLGAPAIVENVDSDEELEVLAYDYNYSERVANIAIWDVEGNLENRFSLPVPQSVWPNIIVSAGELAPENPGKELVVNLPGVGIRLYNAAGNELTIGDWPIAITDSANAVTLANLDGEGGLDLVICRPDSLVLLGSDGSPFSDPIPIAHNCSIPPMVADVDGDGSFEILVRSAENISIFALDGTLVSTIATLQPDSSIHPKIVNVDDEPGVEIVSAVDNRLIANKPDGSELTNGHWPKIFPETIQILAVDDLMNEGHLQFFVAAGLVGYLYDLPVQNVPNEWYWRAEYGNSQRSMVSQQCGSGTLFDSCSVNKPLYCANGVMSSRCDLCGCSSGVCNIATGVCVSGGKPKEKAEQGY